MSVKSSMKKILKAVTLNNVVGFILAILIIFELKVESEMKRILNTPFGMVASLFMLLLIFIFLNPVVGILFLIYLYECVKGSDQYTSMYKRSAEVMKNLNVNVEKRESDKVELNMIQKMAPIIKKSENANVVFVANSSETSMTFDTV